MMSIEEYILGHIDAEPNLLRELYREANLHLVNGYMASGHLQGRILKMFVQMIAPHNILEIGTFAGYSALCMAEALEQGGKIFTFDKNDELEAFTRSWITKSGLEDKIEFIIGDAISEAPKLGILFDMVFIDGDKRTYIEAYEMALSVLQPSGYIIVDDTLWDGHLLDPSYSNDKQTQGILRFNAHVAQDTRVEKVILPVQNGMTIIKKKQ